MTEYMYIIQTLVRSEIYVSFSERKPMIDASIAPINICKFKKGTKIKNVNNKKQNIDKFSPLQRRMYTEHGNFIDRSQNEANRKAEYNFLQLVQEFSDCINKMRFVIKLDAFYTLNVQHLR